MNGFVERPRPLFNALYNDIPTAFGDDNHKKIDVAIAVLSGKREPDDYEDADENSEAYNAECWMNGEDLEDGSPAEQWKELVKE